MNLVALLSALVHQTPIQSAKFCILIPPYMPKFSIQASKNPVHDYIYTRFNDLISYLIKF